MGLNEIPKLTTDGSVNPSWLTYMSNNDPLMCEIAIYFLSGDKLKTNVQCLMPTCFMQNRTCTFIDQDSNENEFEPMMFCYFCDRTFHTGCLDLDAHLINDESVPWKCSECSKDLLNKYCDNFYKHSKYETKVINRRSNFIQSKFLPEDPVTFRGDLKFNESDMKSFERRAFQILKEEDPETVRDKTLLTPLVFKQVMKARADKKRAKEVSERFSKELQEALTKIKELESSRTHLTDTSCMHDTTAAFQNIQLSSTLRPSGSGDRATTSLTSLYTGSDRTSNLERNNFQYNPQEVNRDNLHDNTANVSEPSLPQNSQTDINPSEISLLIARLTRAQERTEDRQLLEARRKAIPKLSEFNGDESKWLTFKQDVERYRKNCRFDDETVKLYVRGALKGDAYNIVRDIFDIESLDTIMATLKNAYGDEMKLVRNRSEELRNLKFGSALYKSDAVKLQSAIQAYFSACNYAKVGYINTNSIAESIFCQFSPEDRQRCKEFYLLKNPTASTIVLNVQGIYDYIMYRMPLLDDGPPKKRSSDLEQNKVKSKSFQVQAVSVSTPQNEAFKFEIRDKQKSPYLGYNLEKVALIKKECDLCASSDHYPVQCPQFKEKNEAERMKLILDKHLCKNCVLTSSHRANICDVKSGCGYRSDKTCRCSEKHHISIHGASNNSTTNIRNRPKYRRSNTRNNTTKALQKVNDATATIQATRKPETNATSTVAFHAVDPKEVRKYDVLAVGDGYDQNETPKSVKVFKLKFWGPKGHVIAYGIGDSGSEVTLIRDDLREALGIIGTPHTLNLQWADKSTRTCNATQIDIKIQGTNDDAKKFELKNVFATSDLNLPHRSLNMDKLKNIYPHLKGIPFEGYQNEQPVMLIGSPHAYLIEGCKLVENGSSGPVAIKTKIGWSVYGGTSNFFKFETSVTTVADVNDEETTTCDIQDTADEQESKLSNDTLSRLLTQHFSIESLGVRTSDVHYTADEKKALELLQDEIKILDNGFVEAPLVWNRKNKVIPSLPNNYPLVLQRQLAQERKLKKHPEQLKAFNDNVKELLEQGFIREATEEDMSTKWENIWYLPMTLVINQNKNPPKMRNVYDASSVYKGESLNKNLLKGPDMLVNILKPLIRMRVNKVAFTADVKSMFNMIKISKRDQQCQRILWRENEEAPMKTYISSVMMFGMNSSPFTSQFVKNMTAEKWMDKYPDAARALIEWTYMDDLLTSEPNLEKALEVSTNCIDICNSINWKLVGFQSNCPDLLRMLPSHAVKKDAIPLPDADTENCVTKVLGCFWNIVDDCYEFKLEKNIFVKMVNEFNVKPTKRDQASTLARIYDVLGLISHFTIRGKILLQRSWANKINWDETIDDKSAKDWLKWLQQANEVAKLKFNRRLSRMDALKDADEIQLHVFADAGAEAFGAVAYLVAKSTKGIDVSLVMSKAKVTPLRLKTATMIKEMPRLELMAALVAARLSKTISECLQIPNMKKFFWCDSEVVLRWIHNPNQKLLKYAVGPIEEILETTKRNDWRYVPTQLNVADLCTKMKRFDFSCNHSAWMNGPEFLRKDQNEWPQFPEKLLIRDEVIVNNIYLQQLKYSSHKLPPVNCPIANDEIIERFRPSILSSWNKLVRAVARALKIFMDVFIPLVQNKQLQNVKAVKGMKKLIDGLNYLSPKDLERAEHFIFRKVQREAFPQEYQAFRDKKPIKNVMMNQLNVFMDHEGILRINSRVNLNDLCFPQQFAPLLPSKNPLVTVLLAHYHYKFKHIAIESQIAEVRSKVWIPQLKQAFRSIKAKCNWCNLVKAKPYSPPMAPLPVDRIDPQLKPFQVVGIDVLGPLKPTVNGNKKKVYILIFACTLTRYIHLHILDSLESLRVLEAIVTFWTAYGPVHKFISDNATNFTAAAKILREDAEKAKLFKQQIPSLLQNLSQLYNVEWQFNAVHAPWFGGMYERLIKEVKRSLAATLERRKINRVELNIAVQEAAHRINCRPLTDNPLEPSGIMLTPHDLAKYKSGWPLLPGIHKDKYEPAPERSIYRRGRLVADEIMRKFTSFYLPVLTKRTKWHKNESPPRVGDLVLVIEPNMTRKEWKRAKITKIYLGKDGVARVADVEMASGTVKMRRAIRNLAKITLSTSLSQEDAKPNVNSIAILMNSNLQILTEIQNSNFAQLLTVPNISSSIPVNLILLFTQAQINYLYNYREMAEVKPKTSFKPPGLLQIDGVASDMKLSEVIQALEPEYKSIIGAARVFDYLLLKSSTTVFLYITDEEEFRISMRARHRINKDSLFSISFPSFIMASAYLPVNFMDIDENRIKASPKPFAIFGMPTFKGSTSNFVADVVASLEKYTNVTAFRWILKDDKPIPRNFAFACSSSYTEVKEIIGNELTVKGNNLLIKRTETVSLVLHPVDAYLVNINGRTILTPKIIASNWLCSDLRTSLLGDELQREFSSFFDDAERDLTVTTTNELASTQPDDDTVVISLSAEDCLMDIESGNDTSDPVNKVIPTAEPTPCTSRSVQMTDDSRLIVKAVSIENQPTDPIDVQPPMKKSKDSSRFLKLRLKPGFTFDEFYQTFLSFLKKFEIVVFIKRATEVTAHIEFLDEGHAKGFKRVVENWREDKNHCSVKFRQSESEPICLKGTKRTIRPSTETDVMFLIDKNGHAFKREYKGQWSHLEIN